MCIFAVWMLVGFTTFICCVIGGEKEFFNDHPLLTGAWGAGVIALVLLMAKFSPGKDQKFFQNEKGDHNAPTSG